MTLRADVEMLLSTGENRHAVCSVDVGNLREQQRRSIHRGEPAMSRASRAIMGTMPDDSNPFELDLDGLYERYLVTCRMSGASGHG